MLHALKPYSSCMSRTKGQPRRRHSSKFALIMSISSECMFSCHCHNHALHCGVVLQRVDLGGAPSAGGASPQLSQPLLPKLRKLRVMPPAAAASRAALFMAMEGGGAVYGLPSASALIFSRRYCSQQNICCDARSQVPCV